MADLTLRQKSYLKELENTKIPQSIGQLGKDESRCALGIACEVFNKDSGLSLKVQSLGSIGKICFDRETKHLPFIVKEYFGFNTVSGGFKDPISYRGVDYNSIAHINDEGSISFKALARLIKNNSDIVFANIKEIPEKKLQNKPNPVKKKV